MTTTNLTPTQVQQLLLDADWQKVHLMRVRNPVTHVVGIWVLADSPGVFEYIVERINGEHLYRQGLIKLGRLECWGNTIGYDDYAQDWASPVGSQQYYLTDDGDLLSRGTMVMLAILDKVHFHVWYAEWLAEIVENWGTKDSH